MTADGAYDTRRCHNAIADRGAAAVKGRTVRQLICATESSHTIRRSWPAEASCRHPKVNILAFVYATFQS